MIIVIALFYLTTILYYLVIFDVILSWLTLAGIRFRPRFVSSILDPLYLFVRKYIPTRIGAFELTPVIILIGLLVINIILTQLFPEASSILSNRAL